MRGKKTERLLSLNPAQIDNTFGTRLERGSITLDRPISASWAGATPEKYNRKRVAIRNAWSTLSDI